MLCKIFPCRNDIGASTNKGHEECPTMHATGSDNIWNQWSGSVSNFVGTYTLTFPSKCVIGGAVGNSSP